MGLRIRHGRTSTDSFFLESLIYQHNLPAGSSLCSVCNLRFLSPFLQPLLCVLRVSALIFLPPKSLLFITIPMATPSSEGDSDDRKSLRSSKHHPPSRHLSRYRPSHRLAHQSIR